LENLEKLGFEDVVSQQASAKKESSSVSYNSKTAPKEAVLLFPKI
jgi:hypothetical protein